MTEGDTPNSTSHGASGEQPDNVMERPPGAHKEKDHKENVPTENAHKPILRIKCRGVVKGIVVGEALVMKRSFSFMGDVDMDTSEIIARDHEHYGTRLAGRIMIYPETKGSSGGCVVLMSLYEQGRQPGAIVNTKMADHNLVEGAILSRVPLACLPETDPAGVIRTGDIVRLDAEKGWIELLERTGLSGVSGDMDDGSSSSSEPDYQEFQGI